MADPLSVLRDFVRGGRAADIALGDDGRVHFADQYSFAAAARTAFKSAQSADFYDLQSVALFIQVHAERQVVGEYAGLCRARRVAPVHLTDRKVLRDYLLGLLDASAVAQLSEAPPPPAAAPEAEEPPAKKPRAEDPGVDPMQAALQALRRQERQLRDRNSMLLAPGGRVFTQVLALADRAARREEGAAKAAAAAAARARPKEARPGGQQPAFFKPSGRTERDTRAETAKALGQAEELGLGYGAAAPGGGGAPAPGAARPQQQQQPARPAPPPGGKQQRPAAAAAAGGGGKPKRGGGRPIVLVPPGLSALVNMYNARQLLEGLTFVRSQEVMASEPAKPASATIQRAALRERPVAYVVTDQAPPPRSSDWKRVVAVIVQGKAWQFKDWPFKGAKEGNLVELFNKVLGIYLHFADEPVPPAVKSWNVRPIPLQRDNRHLDRAAVLELYRALDAYLAERRCELEY